MTSPKKNLDSEKDSTFFGELEKVEVSLELRIDADQKVESKVG